MEKSEAGSNQGSGSAENLGRSRTDQQQPQPDAEQVAKEIGNPATPVIGLHDLGAMSGRDDAAGGSGDNMEATSGGEPTERF